VENGKWFEVAVEGPIITNLKDFGLQAAIDGLGIAFATQQMIAPQVAFEAGRPRKPDGCRPTCATHPAVSTSVGPSVQQLLGRLCVLQSPADNY
jgi:DNA-binding transcriptional LysR family regulator